MVEQPRPGDDEGSLYHVRRTGNRGMMKAASTMTLLFSYFASTHIGSPAMLIVVAHPDAIPAVLAVAPPATLIPAHIDKEPSTSISWTLLHSMQLLGDQQFHR